MPKTLEKLLSGYDTNPETGLSINLPIDQVIIEAGIAKDAKDIISSLDIGKKFCVVSDVNTHPILAQEIERSLSGAISYILPATIKPTMDAVQKTIEAAGDADAIVAIGSGTINDICKYASYNMGKPYVVFGTAPSMNGYTSANASIIEAGHKKTLTAHMPKAVILDLDIISTAPKRLIRSGLGDSLCRPTAQTDWLLSHLLLGTKYNELPFTLLKEYEADLFANSHELVKGNKEIMHLLANTLIISGFGMYICGGSFPASQGEHLIAHSMEMRYEHDLPQTYHGEEVGVTTLTMVRLQEELLQKDLHIKIPKNYEKEIIEFFGKETGRHCVEEYANKISAINKSTEKNWDGIKQQISKVTISANTLQSTLQKAGSPTTAKELGWDEAEYKKAISHAKYIRNRFGFLDLYG